MFIEGSFSWDQDAERTSLEWPPPLSSPEIALSPAEGARNGRIDDDIDILPDPELTPAELRALRLDGTVSAAFFTADQGRPSEGPSERRSLEATHSGDLAQVYLDESDSWEDEEGALPRRRPSGTRGPLLILGTAVTVALTGGFAAQAFGWRMPPRLRESAEPMTAFFRNLTPSRLVALVGTTDRPLPKAPDEREGDGFNFAGAARPVLATSPVGGSRSASEAMGLGSTSQAVVDTATPGGAAWVEGDAAGDEPVACLAPPPPGAVERIERPGEGDTVATESTLQSLPGVGLPSDRADLASRNAQAPREHLPRAARGLVWSPSVNGLAPAIGVPSASTSSSITGPIQAL